MYVKKMVDNTTSCVQMVHYSIKRYKMVQNGSNIDHSKVNGSNESKKWPPLYPLFRTVNSQCNLFDCYSIWFDSSLSFLFDVISYLVNVILLYLISLITNYIRQWPAIGGIMSTVAPLRLISIWINELEPIRSQLLIDSNDDQIPNNLIPIYGHIW